MFMKFHSKVNTLILRRLSGEGHEKYLCEEAQHRCCGKPRKERKEVYILQWKFSTATITMMINALVIYPIRLCTYVLPLLLSFV